jgi:hypothetical protein
MITEFALEPDEAVVRQTRKHWFLFVTSLVPFAILAVLPLAIPRLLMLSSQMVPYAEHINFGTPLMRGAYGLWLLMLWTTAWGTFTRYFLNAWVLTNQRIVDIKQHAYFNREVSSVLLSRVQDVTTNVIGVIPSLLHIGSINVQSAGAVNEFHMYGIPKPEEMRDLILKYVPVEPKSTGI